MIPTTLQIPPPSPQPPDADRLGVEEHYVSAVAAQKLQHPLVLGEVRVTRFQERPDVGCFGEAPSAIPASRALEDCLRAHPVLEGPALLGTKGHRTRSSVERLGLTRERLKAPAPPRVGLRRSKDRTGAAPGVRRGFRLRERCPCR